MTDTHADAHAHAHVAPKHPYHLVDPSPWPLVGAIAGGVMAGGAVLFMHGFDHGTLLLIIGALLVLGTMFVWWRAVRREATFEGHHTPVVQIGLRFGMALFIASEVMFFSAFFWAFFTSSLFPVGGVAGFAHDYDSLSGKWWPEPRMPRSVRPRSDPCRGTWCS